MKTIKDLEVELDARKAALAKTQAALDRASEAVAQVGEEPPPGTAMRFEARLASGSLYTFAALRVKDKGWYLTGDLSDVALMLACSHGPHSWDFVCSKIEPGTARFATNWSTSTRDASPVRPGIYGPRVGASINTQRTGEHGARSPEPGEFFDTQGRRARAFMIGVDPAPVAGTEEPGKTPLFNLVIGEMGGNGTLRILGSTTAKPGETAAIRLDAASASVFAGQRYQVFTRSEVRQSTRQPGQETVQVHEVRDMAVPHTDAVPEVVASFEGDEGAWQAAQSAWTRNYNAVALAARKG